MLDADRDQLAQETAEYIAGTLIPESDRVHAFDNVTVSYPDDRRPPQDVPGIKAELLAGRFWISWMNDRVLSALRTIHAARRDYDGSDWLYDTLTDQLYAPYTWPDTDQPQAVSLHLRALAELDT